MPEIATQAEPVLDIRHRVRDHLHRKYGVALQDADPLLRLAEIAFDKSEDTPDQISALKALMPYTYASVRSVDIHARVDHTVSVDQQRRVQGSLTDLLDGLADKKASPVGVLEGVAEEVHLNSRTHTDSEDQAAGQADPGPRQDAP